MPTQIIVLGPEPIHVDGVGAYYDQSNIRYALNYLYETRDVRGGIAFSEEDWLRFPPEDRFDLRELSTLDPGDQKP